VLIDDDQRPYYAERLLCLPSYQANDSQRKISAQNVSRSELGLPEHGFVFCCFNATYKLTPHVFECWMRILGRVNGSYLYLYVDNEIAQRNLLKNAERLGADPRRLVFGTRIALDRYLARYAAMDLFLDTSPYNAGTTASDALFAGLPVLTYRGSSMAGRMASSLLTAIGLPELITDSMTEYEDAAVRFATRPDLMRDIRDRLAVYRSDSPLFDTAQFVKHMEAALAEIYNRHHADLAPADVFAGA
jgi:predicted O-linked N-acetylglucosamine transferase (SPINDLY family)